VHAMLVEVRNCFVRILLVVHMFSVCTNVHRCQRRQDHRDEALGAVAKIMIGKNLTD
jgi:uncharacterized membrane protein